MGINAWVIHRDPRVWGDDADEFVPERWLGPSEKVAILEANSFAVGLHMSLTSDHCLEKHANDSSQFGYGARTCLGKNISLLELTKLLPQLLRQIDFVPVDDRDWEVKTAWFVKQKYEVQVKLRSAAM